MQNENSQNINKRFFQALDELVEAGKITYFRFCVNHNISRRNFIRLKNEPQREFQMEWLSILVDQYGYSGDWLLTGRKK